MRLGPVLIAMAVGVFFYAFVMHRDTLLLLAGAEPDPAVQAEEMPEEGKVPVGIVALRSQAQNVDAGVVMRGRTEARRRVEVRAEVTGLVAAEPQRRGALVQAGDLLCEIAPGTRPAQLAEAEARLQEAEANAQASERLAERGYTAETTAMANRAALQSAQAGVDQAQREIARLRILAPFAGLLEDDAAEIGALLQPGSACATIIDLDPIKLVGHVPERVVDEIRLGAQVAGRLVGGAAFVGRVSFVARAADPDTRTFRVEAEVPNPDLAIRDGVSVEIQVALEGSPAHLLPMSALTLDDQGRLGVRGVEAGAARFMPVSVIRDSPEGVWLAGLPETLDVIVVGQDFVTDGQAVRVTYRDPAP